MAGLRSLPSVWPRSDGEALKQVRVYGAEHLAEDEQVAQRACALRRCGCACYAFQNLVACAQSAAQQLKDSGLPQLLKKLIAVEQGFGMLLRSPFEAVEKFLARIARRKVKRDRLGHRRSSRYLVWI